MKREIAKANGTYIPDRRGRKRKSLGERWTPMRKRRNISIDYYEDSMKEDYDATEDEDDNDLSRDGEESIIDGQSSTGVDLDASLVPKLKMRSATTPILRRPRSKVAPSPLRSASRFSSMVVSKTSETSPHSDSLPHSLNLLEDPDKQQRTPPKSLGVPDESSLKEQLATTCDEPIVWLDKHEFLESIGELMRKGEEQYRNARLQDAAEKSSLRNVFEASVSRARKAAHEAQDQLKAESLEYADVLKVKDREQAEELLVLKEELETLGRSKAQEHTEFLALEQELDGLRKSNDQEHTENLALKRELESLRNSNDQHHANEVDALKKQLEEVRMVKDAYLKNQRRQCENLEQNLEAHKSTSESLRVAKENSEREYQLMMHQQTQEIESLRDSLIVQKGDWERRSGSHEKTTEALRQELRSSREEAERLNVTPELHSELKSLKCLLSRQSTRMELFEDQRSKAIHMLDGWQRRQEQVRDRIVELKSKQQSLLSSILQLIDELHDLSVKATTKRLEAGLQMFEDIGHEVSMAELGAKEQIAALVAYRFDLTNAEAPLDLNGNDDQALHDDGVANSIVQSTKGTGDHDSMRDAQGRTQSSNTNGVIDHSS